MTTLSGTQLTHTQLIALSGATQRPRVAGSCILPSTLMNVSASANLWLSKLNTHSARLLCTLQHSLPGGPLWPYPGRTFTG
jgi:hypothetical protein